jgi:hypothetical protein
MPRGGRCRRSCLGEVAAAAPASDGRHRHAPSGNRPRAHIGGMEASSLLRGASPPTPLRNETLASCSSFFKRPRPGAVETDATLDQGFPGYFGSLGLHIYIYIYIYIYIVSILGAQSFQYL